MGAPVPEGYPPDPELNPDPEGNIPLPDGYPPEGYTPLPDGYLPLPLGYPPLGKTPLGVVLGQLPCTVFLAGIPDNVVVTVSI